MGLSVFLDAVGDHLRKDLSPPAPALIGGSEPVGPAQLPAVTLSVAGVSSPHPGIGHTPRAAASGALAMSATIDLAAPYIDFPDGRALLLAPPRKVLQLPHGGIVPGDGTREPRFVGVVLTDAAGKKKTFKVVNTAPRPGEVRPDQVTGQLTFGSPLPAKGKIDASYYVGTWEVRSERFAGDLRLDAFAGDASAADSLSRRLEASLAPERSRRIAGLRTLAPTAWGPLGQVAAETLRRSLIYRFEYEREEPVVVTSGGPIERVQVTATSSVGETDDIDKFDVTTREGSR